MCSFSQERAFLSWEKQARYQKKKEGRKEAVQETAGDRVAGAEGVDRRKGTIMSLICSRHRPRGGLR